MSFNIIKVKKFGGGLTDISAKTQTQRWYWMQVDREADLLNRGRNVKMLDGLRKRISSLFLAFAQTPEFNPEASKLQVESMPADAYVYQSVGKIVSPAAEIRM